MYIHILKANVRPETMSCGSARVDSKKMLFSAHRLWGQIWKYPSKKLGPFINISIHLSIHHVIHGGNQCIGCLDRFVVAKNCEGKGAVLLWVLSGPFTIYQPSFGGYAIYFDLPICGSIDISTSKVIIMHILVPFQVFQKVQLYKKHCQLLITQRKRDILHQSSCRSDDMYM